MAEDDLACTCADINRFFDICRQERLDLAQPALALDSYFNLAITLESPCFRLRYTSFVEIMAPCFSADALVKVLPTLKESLSGYGLEELWVMLLGEGASVAIIDEVPNASHTADGGRAALQSARSLGKSAWGELQQVFEKYGITQRRFWTRSAITKSGKRSRTGFAFFSLRVGSLAGGSTIEGGASRIAARLANCNVSADQRAATVTRTQAAKLK